MDCTVEPDTGVGQSQDMIANLIHDLLSTGTEAALPAGAFDQRIDDFGPEIGVKRSSAQITKYYTKDELLGRLVLGVVNFPPKQIGPFRSECLTLGVPDEHGNVVLLSPTQDVPIGGKMF